MNVSINHPTDRPNFTEVRVNGITLWFSYRTVVGFQADGAIVISENLWGPTTGKHLNWLGDTRTPRAEFDAMLSEALNGSEIPA